MFTTNLSIRNEMIDLIQGVIVASLIGGLCVCFRKLNGPKLKHIHEISIFIQRKFYNILLYKFHSLPVHGRRILPGDRNSQHIQ